MKMEYKSCFVLFELAITVLDVKDLFDLPDLSADATMIIVTKLVIS